MNYEIQKKLNLMWGSNMVIKQNKTQDEIKRIQKLQSNSWKMCFRSQYVDMLSDYIMVKIKRLLLLYGDDRQFSFKFNIWIGATG